MVFSQQVEANQGGFYPGTQIESAPTNSLIFVTAYNLLSQTIPPQTTPVIAISENPLVFPAPPNADLIVGLTINGIYTEDFIYNPNNNTITINQ